MDQYTLVRSGTTIDVDARDAPNRAPLLDPPKTPRFGRVPPSGLTTLLTEFAASGVELVLVGGLATIAHSAPVTTFEVDPRRDLGPLATPTQSPIRSRLSAGKACCADVAV